MSDTENNLVKSVQIGDRLKQARTSAGLEISDIATDLRISAEYIESLELNQFEQVGAPTYVKGYLRSYANALKLSPEALVEEYETLGYETPNLNVASPLEVSSGNKMLVTSSLFVALVTFGLFVYWLINSGHNDGYSAQSSEIQYTEPQTALPTLAQASTQLPLVNASKDAREATVEASTDVMNAATNADLLGTPLVSGAETGEALVQQEVQVVSDTELTSEVIVAEEGAGIEVSAEIVASAPTQTFSEAQIISADEGSDEIILSLSAESWIEIEDATHFQLMIGVYPEDTSIILTGQAPFQVFLGYAPGVEIIFNGSVYESEPHRRANNTAKFALIN